jgi:hypothetical protein
LRDRLDLPRDDSESTDSPGLGWVELEPPPSESNELVMLGWRAH